MNKSILLVNPPAEVPRECYDTPDYPAIGIASVAGYLIKNGVECSVIDGKLSRLSVDDTIQEIIGRRPRILGLTAMTHMIVTAHRIASAVKAQCPDTIIVLGGFHASFLPERTLREFPSFDYIVVGEGEIAFHKFVRAVFDGGDPAEIQGIAGRRGGAIRVNGRGEIADNLDDLGMPAWELFPRARMYPVMSQRGCPFGCNFCSRPYGRKVRRRSVPHVIAEIKRNIEQFGCTVTDFYDETFTVNKKHAAELCRAIIAEGINRKVRFWAYVHANTIDLPTARLLKEANFSSVGFGVESGNPQIMARMKKNVGPEDVLRAARVLREAGLDFAAYFIIGHPNETRETAWDTIRLAAKVNPNSVAIGLMVPYPGSEIWELATHSQGGYKLIGVNWEDFNKQIGNALELENLPRRTMERLQLQGYLYVYLRNLRFREMFEAIWINRKRIAFILRKLIRPSRRVASSSWLEPSRQTLPAT